MRNMSTGPHALFVAPGPHRFDLDPIPHVPLRRLHGDQRQCHDSGRRKRVHLVSDSMRSASERFYASLKTWWNLAIVYYGSR